MLRVASEERAIDPSVLGNLEIKQDRVYCRNEDGTPKLKLDSQGNVIMKNNGSAEIEYETGGSALMHNKYIVEFIEEGRGAVFTGSFNYSDSAETNEENILITRDASAVEKYFENFMYLWNKVDEYDYIPAEYLYPPTDPPIEAPIVKKVWRKNEYEIVDCNDFDLWDNQWPNRTSFGDH
jgi:phosphatidylserine/phosphatidylglycerophosphate/cardiolipin synthase-like enzyme